MKTPDEPTEFDAGSEEPHVEGAQTIEGLEDRIHGPQDFLTDIAIFHEKFGMSYRGLPRQLPLDLATFRKKFMDEELTEWWDHMCALDVELSRPVEDQDQANIAHHLEETLDAGVDLLYVLLGTMYLQGLLPHFDEAWRRVQRANMAKVRADADSTGAIDSGRDKRFDIVKPRGWLAPSHIDLVERNAHNAAVDAETQP